MFQTTHPTVRTLTAAAALALLAGAPHALAQTYTWTRGAGLDGWNNPDNWDPQGPPTNGSNVVIGSGFPRITCWEIFHLSLASIDARSPLWMAPTHLTVGEATFDGVLFNLSTLNAGTLNLPGANFWLAGSIHADTFTVPQDATLTLDTGGTGGVPVLNGCALVNQGQVTAANRIELRNGAIIENNGAWNADGYSITQVAVPGRFLNTGNFYTTGEPTTSVPFDNTGRVEALSGFATFNGGGRHGGGRFAAASGATVSIRSGVGAEHSFVGPTIIEGAGTVQLLGSGVTRIEPGGAVAAQMQPGLSDEGLWLNSGTLNVTGGLTNTGRMRWSGRIEADAPDAGPGLANLGDALLIITNGSLAAPLLNEADVNQVGQLTLVTGAQVRNGPGGSWLIAGTLTHLSGATNVGFENRGNIVTSEFEPGFYNITVPLTMLGGSTIDMDVQSGSVTLAAGPGQHVVRDGVVRFETALEGDLAVGSGATLVVEPSGTVLLPGNGDFSINNNGTLRIEQAGLVEVPEDESDIYLKGGRIVGEGQFITASDFHWTGGEIALTLAPGMLNQGDFFIGFSTRLNGRFRNRDRVYQDGGILTLDAAGLVNNEAVWYIDGNATIAGSTGGLFVNEEPGLISVDPEGLQTHIAAILDNRGTIIVEDEGSLRISGPLAQLSGSTLTGGTWKVVSGATLTTAGRLIHALGPGTSVRVEGTWPELQLNRVSGELTVPAGTTCTGGAPFRITGGGSCTLEESGTLEVPGDIEIESILDEIDEVFVPALRPPPPPGGTPRITGYIAQNVRNAGNASPGTRGLPGPLHIIADYHQLPEGVLHTDLQGTLPIVEHDQALITGDASLAGVLNVTILPPFVPEPGQEFTVLTASSVTGRFDEVRTTGLPADLQLAVLYTPTAVTLRVSALCRADFTGDGFLTLADFVAFRNAYTSGNMTADFNGDGTLTLADFIQYRNAYTAGCE